MPKRTSKQDARKVADANDVEEVVVDKRAGWRATPAKARRRQRRYGKRIVDELAERYHADNALAPMDEGIDDSASAGPARDDV